MRSRQGTFRLTFGWMLSIWFDSMLCEVQFSSALGSGYARFSAGFGTLCCCFFCLFAILVGKVLISSVSSRRFSFISSLFVSGSSLYGFRTVLYLVRSILLQNAWVLYMASNSSCSRLQNVLQWTRILLHAHRILLLGNKLL